SGSTTTRKRLRRRGAANRFERPTAHTDTATVEACRTRRRGRVLSHPGFVWPRLWDILLPPKRYPGGTAALPAALRTGGRARPHASIAVELFSSILNNINQ